MAKLLSEFELAQFREDGITFPLRVLQSDVAHKLRADCDELEAQMGGMPRTVDVRQMHLHFRWAYELAVQPRVLNAVEDVLGGDLLIWATELFAKHPQNEAVSIGWHRDQPYMGFEAGVTVTAWIALSNSIRANGCMRAVLEGNRRKSSPRRTPPEVSDTNNDGDKVVDVELAAGEMSLHDVHVYHGSGPNLSQEKRVGFAVRFVTPEARPLNGRPPVILARGQDRFHHFEIVGPPADVGAERALSGMRNSAARHLEAMLHNLRQTT